MMKLKFKLLKKQAEYVSSKSMTTIFAGGVGAGKTISNICLAIKYALEYPGIKIMIVAPTYQMLHDTIIAEFTTHCPAFLIERFLIGTRPEARFYKSDNGRQSKIIFRSFDDAFKPKSFTLGLLIIDEVTAVPQDILDELLNRLRQHEMPNLAFFSTNADSKEHYIYKRFIQPILSNEVTKEDINYIHVTTYDNKRLPLIYFKRLEVLKKNRPLHYLRSVMGEWGELDEDQIGVFQKIPKFTSPYLVAFIDSSYSDKTKSDHTSVSIVGFVAQYSQPQYCWPIEFTGMSWLKSISNSAVINELLLFLDKFGPIETCLESQLGDSTQLFIDRLKQAENELNLKYKNHWTYFHQTKNKHERISLNVAGNRDRLFVVEDTNPVYLNPIIGYTKDSKHDDEADSLAGAVNLWQTSKILWKYIQIHQRSKKSA